MVAAITDMIRSRGVVIHLICFDKIAAKRMAKLAEKNGGEVVVQPSWGENPNE